MVPLISKTGAAGDNTEAYCISCTGDLACQRLRSYDWWSANSQYCNVRCCSWCAGPRNNNGIVSGICRCCTGNCKRWRSSTTDVSSIYQQSSAMVPLVSKSRAGCANCKCSILTGAYALIAGVTKNSRQLVYGNRNVCCLIATTRG